MTTSPEQGSDFPLSPELQERSRKLVAERLGWPGGALEACREIESRFPRWYCWWTSSPYPDPGFQPAYGAARIGAAPLGGQSLYARTAGELAELIKTGNAKQPLEGLDA